MRPVELTALQRVMARLYTDDALRARFYGDPARCAGELGISAEDARYVAAVDRREVEAFAASLGRKDRAGTRNVRGRRWWWPFGAGRS